MLSAALFAVTALLGTGGAAIEVRDGAIYPLGTLVTGPCGSSPELPPQGSPGQVVHQWRTETHIDAVDPRRNLTGGRYPAWPVAPDSGCRPLPLDEPGEYHASIYREEDDWRWDAGGWDEISSVTELDLPGDWERDFRVSGKLHANAGGPYAVTRGRRVKLDGSRSGPGKRIKSWQWELAPGADCPAGLKLSSATLAGKTVAFAALCDLRVRLTVTDDRHRRSAPASAIVDVHPRGGAFKQTPFSHHDVPFGDLSDARIPLGEPLLNHPTTVGKNRSACNDDDHFGAILCPWVPYPRTMLDRHFRIARVREQGKPFNDFVYVTDPQTKIERVGLINPHFQPHGPTISDSGARWYDVNHAHTDVDAYLRAAIAHEGKGVPGSPATGHSSAMLDALRRDAARNDPRQTIEQLIDQRPDRLERRVNQTLRDVQQRLSTASDDPLPGIWAGTLWAYNPPTHTWEIYHARIPDPLIP